MRFISVRELRGKSAQVWRWLADEKELVVTCNGRPLAIISAVTGNRLEETLGAIRKARAVMAVASMQRRSARRGADRLTAGDVAAEIAQVRARRLQ